VKFTVDFRHADAQGLARMDAALRAAVAEVTVPGIEITVEQVVEYVPTPFDADLRELIRAGAERAGLSHMALASGAGHDAVYVARTAPAAMIFVPCKDGISHNEIEDARPEHLEAGANVLLHAMLARAGVA
jgi:N-carbamoyl-L-amino-acid hydrolase